MMQRIATLSSVIIVARIVTLMARDDRQNNNHTKLQDCFKTTQMTTKRCVFNVLYCFMTSELLHSTFFGGVKNSGHSRFTKKKVRNSCLGV